VITKLTVISTYKDLETEVSRMWMWKVTTKIMPVIIAALGTIKIRTFSFSQVTRRPKSHRRSH